MVSDSASVSTVFLIIYTSINAWGSSVRTLHKKRKVLIYVPPLHSHFLLPFVGHWPESSLRKMPILTQRIVLLSDALNKNPLHFHFSLENIAQIYFQWCFVLLQHGFACECMWILFVLQLTFTKTKSLTEWVWNTWEMFSFMSAIGCLNVWYLLFCKS